MEDDTIAAIVTPPGEGGVGIVRTSGPASASFAGALFPALTPHWETHRMRYGRLIDPMNGSEIDRAMGVFMQGPRSYTGEDVFEVHCHGSPLVLARVLGSLMHCGCRAARPGEFTLRAFLNGRLDLAQAEAVVDVVRARSNGSLDLAVRDLSGWLGKRITPVYQNLLGLLALMEAMVDFVEEDIPPQVDESVERQLCEGLDLVERLLEGAKEGIVLREGSSLCLLGSPNVGKSSIMNALLGSDRSIVTPIPGTTRDTIEEIVEVRGIAFRVVDTAGITESTDVVEQIGIEKSRRALQSADVVLLVLDRSRPWTESDTLVLEALRQLPDSSETGRRLLVALNKSDLPPALATPDLTYLAPVAVVDSSVVLPTGLDGLRQGLEQAALGGPRPDYVVGNVRHQDALHRSAAALEAAVEGLRSDIPLDLVSSDVRTATAALGEVIGAVVDDELLDRIFRDFCIGK